MRVPNIGETFIYDDTSFTFKMQVVGTIPSMTGKIFKCIIVEVIRSPYNGFYKKGDEQTFCESSFERYYCKECREYYKEYEEEVIL